jgi:hypothetical protein
MDKHTEADIRRIVEDELRKFGIDPDEPEETREVIRWTRRHMQSFNNVGGWIARSLVLVAVTALALAVWEGLKHFLSRSAQ